jgi:hypothetical protein
MCVHLCRRFPNLRKTFAPYLTEDGAAAELPGIYVPQIFLGQLGSYSSWQVEDKNLMSINYLHSGTPKLQLV